VPHDKAVADAEPAGIDVGDVELAFTKNAKKIEASLETKAASDIEFASTARKERNINHELAQKAVDADHADVQKHIAADKAAVHKAAVERKKVVEAATDRVNKAKEDAEAHHIKAQQAQQAAILGRKVGAAEGQAMAQHAWADYRDTVAEERVEALRAQAKARVAKGVELEKMAVNRQTKAMAYKAELVSHNAHRVSEGVTAAAAAKAAKIMERIEGPEGLKNRMTDIQADIATKHLQWATEHEQKMTDFAAGKLDLADALA